MKRASIYLRRNKCIIHSSSQTVDGAWIATEPFSSIESVNRVSVALEIIAALRASQVGVPHPTNFSSRRLLDTSNVSNYSTFVKNTFLVIVTLEGSRITLIPTRNEGSGEGFIPLYDKTIEHVFSEESLQIADWAFEAFKYCE